MRGISLRIQKFFCLGAWSFIGKGDVKNTFFEFAVVYDADILDTDSGIGKDTADFGDTTGLVRKIDKEFVICLLYTSPSPRD